MSLKIAIGGKGGVGKTTVTSLLARCLAANENNKVIAIDADPVANLAAALGISEEEPIIPISGLTELIEERTGAKAGTIGGFFSLNPKVDDIPDKFSLMRDNVKLLVMGTVQSGGSGCICPESTILKALMNHLVLYRDDIVIMDMEAGVEHLGRATSGSVDALIIVVNPGSRSRVAAGQIRKLGTDIGIKNIVVLGNRVTGVEDEELIRNSLPDFEILGFLPDSAEIVASDREGRRPYEDITDAPKELFDIVRSLENLKK
ncbi:MAG: carbon monoxide dehydrogenase [Desulfotalea sp.]|nr:MAG: carbon monoxide dehydrogenase [Desulfotalea sp.]